MMRFASGLLVATLLTTCIISGTFAKYVTSESGADSARVAKWEVGATVGNDKFGTAGTKLNLFEVGKIYDTNGANYTADNQTADTDVKTGTDKAIIAPGTWGKFTYTLQNKSEVNATYAVTYTVDEKTVPLEWSTNGTDWTDDLANISATNIQMGNGTKDITVYWRWAFEDENKMTQRDTADTTLGKADSLAEPSVKIDVTFTQVD